MENLQNFNKTGGKTFSLWLICLAAAILSSTQSLRAQNRQSSCLPDKWVAGKIYLFDGTTFGGALKYDQEAEQVQYKTPQGTLKSFSAIQVEHFSLNLGARHQDLNFFSLPIETDGFEKYEFFELLTDGYHTLLSKSKAELTKVWIPSPYSVGGGYYDNRYICREEFYIMDEKGKVKKIESTKKGLLRLMQKNEYEIKRFLKSEKIKTDKKEDLIKVFSFFNHLNPIKN